MSFAALQTRVNATAIKRLGQDVVLNGTPVTGIFDNASEYATQGNIGYVSTSPMFTMPSAAVPASVVGKTLSVGAQNFTVTAHEPDGTGLSRLLLERSA